VAYHRVFSDLPAKVTYIDISVEAHDLAPIWSASSPP